MSVLKKAGKVGLIVIAGTVALLLLAFFVAMFFSSRGGWSQMGTLGRGQMMNVSSTGLVPTMMNTYDSPLMKGVPNGGRRMMEGTNFVADRADGLPDMMGGADKRIIKTGQMSLRVGNVDQALTKVEAVAREFGGDISDSRFAQSANGLKSGTVTVRVPVNAFGTVFNRLKEVAAVVLSENTSGTDVTAEYIDLQARINNKKAAEATLQTLFERAVKISDVIEVTDKLTAVRSEIESLEGQLRYLGAQTSMSSITLSLTEDVTAVAPVGFRPFETLKESFRTVAHMFGNIAQGLIRLVIVGVPVFLLYGILIWALYRFTRLLMGKFWPGIIEEKRRILRKR